MLKDIIAVEHLGGHRLRLRFEDGVEGELDDPEISIFSSRPQRVDFLARLAPRTGALLAARRNTRLD